MDRKKVTRRTALGMITGGAIMTATGTVAFSDISGSRTASVNVADDPNAYLAIENADVADETSVFTNLTNVEMEVTLDSDDPDYGGATPDDFTLGAGESQEVEIDGTDNTVDVDITAELLSDSETVGSIQLRREFEIPQAGQIELTPNVTGSGRTYEFELENTGEIDVTVDGVRVDSTTEPQADYVGELPGDDVFRAEGNSVVSENLDIGDDEITDLTQTVPIEQDDVVPFAFDRFRRASGQPQNMNGEDVIATVRFEDGSTATVELEP